MLNYIQIGSKSIKFFRKIRIYIHFSVKNAKNSTFNEVFRKKHVFWLKKYFLIKKVPSELGNIRKPPKKVQLLMRIFAIWEIPHSIELFTFISVQNLLISIIPIGNLIFFHLLRLFFAYWDFFHHFFGKSLEKDREKGQKNTKKPPFYTLFWHFSKLELGNIRIWYKKVDFSINFIH